MNYAYLPKVIINLLLPVRFLQHLKIWMPEASARIITWPLTYTVHIYSLLVIMYKHCALAGLEDDIPWMLIMSLLWVLLLIDSWWYVGFLKIWSILKLYFALHHKALIVLQFFCWAFCFWLFSLENEAKFVGSMRGEENRIKWRWFCFSAFVPSFLIKSVFFVCFGLKQRSASI